MIRRNLSEKRGPGGSASRPRPAPHGGGYQDVCTKSGAAVGRALAPDPRLAELRRAGLPQPWPRVAALLGFDTFMVVWQAMATVDGLDGRDRVVWPKLSTYLRYQRNLLMRTLAAEGMSVEQIRDQLRPITSDVPSLSHIKRLVDQA